MSISARQITRFSIVASILGILTTIIFIVSPIRELWRELHAKDDVSAVLRYDNSAFPELPKTSNRVTVVQAQIIDSNGKPDTEVQVVLDKKPFETKDGKGPVILSSFLLGQLNHRWSGYIVNNGNAEVTGVQISIPYDLAKVFWEEGGGSHYLANGKLIYIGDIAPKQKVGIATWNCGENLAQNEIRLYGNEDPFNIQSAHPFAPKRITHDNGVGNIIISDQSEFTTFMESESSVAILCVLSVIGLILISLLFGYFLNVILSTVFARIIPGTFADQSQTQTSAPKEAKITISVV